MEARLALPVSIEQVAVVIKQMSRSDRERLLDSASELRQMPLYAARSQEDRGLAAVERMRAAVKRLSCLRATSNGGRGDLEVLWRCYGGAL